MTGAAVMAAIVPGGSASAATGAAQQVPFDITGWIVNEYSHLCATPSFNFGSLLNFIAQSNCYQSTQLVELVPTRIINGVQLFEIVIVSAAADTGKCYDLANYGGVAPGTHRGWTTRSGLPFIAVSGAAQRHTPSRTTPATACALTCRAGPRTAPIPRPTNS
jgi:hypothetical protein